MTRELVEQLAYLFMGGATRKDFERIHNFDKAKLDAWFKREIHKWIYT